MTFAPVVLNIIGIKINAIDHGAVVNLGASQHFDLCVSYKRNQGFGEQNGDIAPTVQSQYAVWDMDLIDNPTVKSSFL